MENPATGQSPIANQKSPITKKKSTGPRTAAGKKRSSQNAHKHGLFSTAGFFWDAANCPGGRSGGIRASVEGPGAGAPTRRHPGDGAGLASESSARAPGWRTRLQPKKDTK